MNENEEVKRAKGRPKKISEIIEESVNDNDVFGADSGLDGNIGSFGNYNPLQDNVVEREYSTPKTVENLTDEIPEPIFNQELSFEELMQSSDGSEQENEMEAEVKTSAFDNPNPALNDLPPQEKQFACEQMVDTFLDTYSGLHPFVSQFAKFPEEKLQQLILNDEVDGDMSIPTESGEDISLNEFVQTYNEQVEEVFTYDRGFGMKVRPALVRVFMKKGWGMTDEQYLLFMFGKDILGKVTAFYSLKKSINSTFNLLKEIHIESKKGIPTEKIVREEPRQAEFKVPKNEQVEHYEVEEISDEEFDTTLLNVQEFKRPEFEKHPDLVQQEIDKANMEAKKGK